MIFLVKLLIWVPPVLLAITLHEAAHGYVARYFGDSTAEQAGRITLNPLRHIDLVGTFLVPLSIFVISMMTIDTGLLFGWAKPVPVNFANLHKPKANMLWVAAAGPFVNLAMALGWAAIYALSSEGRGGHLLSLMATTGMQINVMLILLNLLPLPPLDGGRITFSLLPKRLAWSYAHIEPYGLPILVVLLLTGVLWDILNPPFDSVMQTLLYLARH
ncbi:MAG: site-2 protease family protein [Azoarcus sp.]|jgi:Zn-dependent protease|nr:site-2 protease family protein [Azoarcus sp.]